MQTQNSSYESLIERGRAKHGDKFDAGELEAEFIPYYENGQRIEVTFMRDDEPQYAQRGYVGATTGWRPAFLLLRSTRAHGSSTLLTDKEHDGHRYWSRVTNVIPGKYKDGRHIRK